MTFNSINNNSSIRNSNVFNQDDLNILKSVVDHPSTLLDHTKTGLQNPLDAAINAYIDNNLEKFFKSDVKDRAEISKLLSELAKKCQQNLACDLLFRKIDKLSKDILDQDALNQTHSDPLLKLSSDTLELIAKFFLETPKDFFRILLTLKNNPLLQVIQQDRFKIIIQHLFEKPVVELELTGRQAVQFYCKWAHLYQGKELKLDFSHCKDLTDEDLKKLAKRFNKESKPTLSSLILPKYSKCSDAGIEAISTIHGLKSIHLPKKKYIFDRNAVEYFAKNCPQIEEIFFEPYTSDLSSSQLEHLSHLKNLKTLELNRLIEIDFKAIVDKVSLGEIEWPWPKLEHLMKKSPLILLSFEQVQMILAHCPFLKTFTCNIIKLNNEGISALKNCPNLENISLGDFQHYGCSAKDLKNSFSQLKNLKRLSLVTNNEKNKDLGELFRELEQLECFISDGKFDNPFAAEILASSCLKLKSVSLPNGQTSSMAAFLENLPNPSGLEDFDGKLTKEQFHLLIQKCPGLKKLKIRGEIIIDDSDLEKLAKCCPHTERLLLYCNGEITNQGLDALSKLKIKGLRIDSPLDNKSIVKIGEYWGKTLEGLGVNTQAIFSDNALENFCKNCKKLQIFHYNMENRNKLMDKKLINMDKKVILALTKNNPFLQMLTLPFTFTLTVAEIKEIIESCPYLDSVQFKINLHDSTSSDQLFDIEGELDFK